MISIQQRRGVEGILSGLATDTRASQIVEFAVALPLLLVLAVGIFDFGSAFNLKQKLTNAAREAARLGASSATNDLTNPAPTSVLAIRDLVVNYLQTARINDCGLGAAAATAAGAATPWKWTFTATCPGGGSFVLSVDRGNVFTSSVTAGGNPVKILSTNVSIAYPYHWQFNRVIGLLVSGASYPATTQIQVNATLENQT
ncbi:MAG TPA: TadE/TadG family type IV pilus assembly protein [Terriglobales bacterium]|nr:TadE/TadG family type IV pilus assembly protein [Terriglobales bacterium]